MSRNHRRVVVCWTMMGSWHHRPLSPAGPEREVSPMTTHSSGDGPDRILVGRYLIGERLGRGGMGIVWRAHDQVLDREVAVKELNVGGLPDEELSTLHSRMKQEAQAAARIDHPGVITIHDVVEQDGRPWIVMELIDGRSLAEIITAEGTLLPRDAARVGVQVLSALRQGHLLGVLHRDVKPANVLIDRRGRVVLTDFGIAMFEGSGGLTRTGEIVGSPDYLAPERVTGHRPGPESDLWALGATLYAAVEGQSPFMRSSTIGTLQAVITDPLPEPRNAGPLFPVIEALLRKDPAERATADEALPMLEEVAQGRTPPTPTVFSPAAGTSPVPGASPASGASPVAGAAAAGAAGFGAGAAGAGAGAAGAGPAGAAPGGDRSSAATQSTPPTPLPPSALPLATPPPSAPPPPPPFPQSPGTPYHPAYGYGAGTPPTWSAPPGGVPVGPGGPGGPVGPVGPGAPNYPSGQNYQGGSGRPGEPGGPPRRHRLWPLLLAAALVAALLAGGVTLLAQRSTSNHAAQPRTSSSVTAPPTTATSTAPTQPPSTAAGTAPAPPAPSPTPTPPAAPASVVTAYYDAINAHDYSTAWNLGGKNLGGSYSDFANGFAGTSSDTLTIDGVSGGTVDVHLHAVHTDGSTADYSGSYFVQNGVITQATLQQTA
ncbi:serine/threonine-protein kinase [Streptacidiphilus sp. EB129]|uniref:serine/threonine-protein kinase n=1 Tax=Streptacidiphilus sp. EB129 TaxID=3156262 RepID=UPI0035165D78